MKQITNLSPGNLERKNFFFPNCGIIDINLTADVQKNHVTSIAINVFIGVINYVIAESKFGTAESFRKINQDDEGLCFMDRCSRHIE